MDQGPVRGLENCFFKYGYNFERDGSRDLYFFLTIDNQKILDTCLGVFQNLDQGSGGALKIVYINVAITLEWMDLET